MFCSVASFNLQVVHALLTMIMVLETPVAFSFARQCLLGMIMILETSVAFVSCRKHAEEGSSSFELSLSD